MNIFEKLKKRWGIQSNVQILIIMLIFAITGFSTLFAKKWIFGLLGITETDPMWFRVLIWLVTILPVYNVLLLFYGAIFGQFAFFWSFFKKMISRFKPENLGFKS